ncbi:MAG TPA: L-aspartate oxidase [Cyclobacteriaceae bacterium]|nr:L-aspartate oxidase [Cyclobacteriaceae bacterium]HMV10553.1 L-aspartate oxidase [Cyclobacteriaceae bacterium]HMV89593.1 L-aspartate oxidase [Cyclobacteriaceae bacterium]HMW99435.1 L-aspartate oxidase [Cyclobacteriaceae bacterium]HMX48776.1 L-aspartate oxidase [Cyclobacteriaceae bacterium]
MPVADVLVVGSGIAGLLAAIKIGEHFPSRKICVITKNEAAESNTQYAQGGISVVTDFLNDSFDSHIKDTLIAGDGLCDEEVVRFVVAQAYDRLEELIAYGVKFDRDSEGRLSLAKEGGHHRNRIVHCKDATGASVSSVLLQKLATLPNVTLLTNQIVIDLITRQPTAWHSRAGTSCHGVTLLDCASSKVSNIFSRTTILATGGLGQVYETTTNPLVATGDGIAMAWRAGAEVSNMEFIQFHPTALTSFGSNPCFLISEAVRGHGAHLINQLGERFMFKYHPDGELACRDVVARAIAMEMNVSGDSEVYLDCAHIAHHLPDKFPTIYQKCVSLGLDLYLEPIPVAPAAHYVCGGVDVDMEGRTTIENLYACGECANTGLHGANRLASNSLLEAMVFAHSCYQDIARRLDNIPLRIESLEVKTSQPLQAAERTLVLQTRASLRKLMTEQVGIIRSEKGLQLTKTCLAELSKLISKLATGIVDFDLQELRNIIDVAQLIVDQSLKRQQNCGAYFNIDHEVHSHFPLERVVQD